jgi:undecaprenyl-diphosphatase
VRQVLGGRLEQERFSFERSENYTGHMGLLQTVDRELVQAATTIGGQGELRDQIVYGLARFLPVSFFLFGLYLFGRGKTPTQRQRNQNVVLIALAGVLIAIGVAWLIGQVYHRERPFVTFPYLHHLDVVSPDLNSFPSGHALVLFTAAGVVYFVGHHPYLSRLLLLIATVVVLARVVAGVHYPSDILAGALLGLGLAKLISWQSEWIDRQLS